MVKKSRGWSNIFLVEIIGLRFTTLIPHRYLKIDLKESIMEGFVTPGSTRCKHFTNQRTHPPTSCEFLVIDQITCSLKFLEEFHLLFQMQNESRRYQSINYDPQPIRKFGEFLDFRKHILIWKKNYINNDKFLILMAIITVQLILCSKDLSEPCEYLPIMNWGISNLYTFNFKSKYGSWNPKISQIYGSAVDHNLCFDTD